ncbi:hypothetical protein [Rhizohabitans arisaemae]|uniref:hypothetical protein n=1 Tax=Rhizohabitans arisaemae TaxID=2720610 RepID=UPI0024B23E7D|nr:hypothetical protein [Rhizohabitans arisaemae]
MSRWRRGAAVRSPPGEPVGTPGSAAGRRGVDHSIRVAHAVGSARLLAAGKWPNRDP